ncbi:glycine--tRNA ligase subunit beta [Moraxella caviae]|uniref:Glycine--tRNA ligase beta subunit n=1 Tax=Moraxella caviae TaxID=34060 RepID=A0A1T0A1Z7_9GAMM|nr:glycine--tRNA ligase subunit beta [Moraxella caviae]OOR89786.1 glycine--tRNA ligase subunit beta [Moraxella caviae]STZ10698.1 Glycine--tRNA ligase beta subunit [Moraxella caviae]
MNILFELGTEEFPPKNLKTLRDSLTDSVKNELAALGIGYEKIQAFAAPRRLALHITGIDEKQADRREQKRGPAIKACFDADGNPTKAAQGFAQGLGVAVSELITISTDKGDYIGYEVDIKGQAVSELLPNVFQKALDNLPIAKRMRSGASKDEFVRPVKWVVLMADAAVIPAVIQGKTTGNQTLGHRFHAPEAITITHADDYETLLKSAYVIADFDARQQSITEQVHALADGATPIMPSDLLDEVTALVDYPVALKAGFEDKFLAVPQEALISTMQADQKYFCLTDKDGKLLPNFIFVSNIDSKDKAQVIAGNEKVVRPRLADAEFFFLQDQKQPLQAFADTLKTRVFQEKLGTIWDKSERIAKLAAFITTRLQATEFANRAAWQAVSADDAVRASLLAKADLATTMVGEFPELQGIAGTYYAHKSGEKACVADAIFEQYLPKFSGDVLPATPIGTALAIADRVDTLVGIFGIGQAPSGSKDPFSLRRASIGVLRILIENKLPLGIDELLQEALTSYGDKIANPSDTLAQVREFINSRYRAMYTEQGVAVDSIVAVQAVNPAQPLDFDERVRAVQAFRAAPQAQILAENNKRVANILAKADSVGDDVSENLLAEAAEKSLYEAVQTAKQTVAPLQKQADYQGVLSALSALAAPLTDFFDNVMVNADDAALKANRLALLAQVRALFLSVADIGELQG